MCFVVYVLGIVVTCVLTIFPLGKILLDLTQRKCTLARYCTNNMFLLIGGVLGFVAGSVFVLNGYAERRNEYLHYVNSGVETVGEIAKVRKVVKPNSPGKKAYAYRHQVIYADENGEHTTAFERAYDYAVGDKVRVIYMKENAEQALVLDFSNGVLYLTLMLMMGLAFASLAISLFLMFCKKFAARLRESQLRAKNREGEG